jgi:phosphoglycolate phosphatase-like HAD superfamily hydrolase
MKNIGTSSDVCVFVGDTVNDSECARRAGVAFAAAGWNPSVQDIPCKYNFTSPLEILTLVE